MTIFTDSATISSSTTTITTVESQKSVDSATISNKSTPSSVDVKSNPDSSTISSTTTFISDEHGPFSDADTPSSITTPGVNTETVISWNISVTSAPTIEGQTLVFSVGATVTEGVTTSTSGEIDYVTPGGYWGTADNDDGFI